MPRLTLSRDFAIVLVRGPREPGMLNRPDAPERIFLPWYLRSLGDPAEYELETLGWEDVEGLVALKLSMLSRPRSSLGSWIGGLPVIRLWIDVERDGYPLRIERFRGEDLQACSEIVEMAKLALPDWRSIWSPSQEER